MHHMRGVHYTTQAVYYTGPLICGTLFMEMTMENMQAMCCWPRLNEVKVLGSIHTMRFFT